MRSMPWNRAPRLKKSRRDCAGALQPEPLEPRLALSHAPLTDYGAGADAPDQIAVAYVGQPYGAQQFSAQPLAAPPSINNWSNDGLLEQEDFGGRVGQAFGESDLSPPMLGNGQWDGSTHFADGTPLTSFANFGSMPGRVDNSWFTPGAGGDRAPLVVSDAFGSPSVEMTQSFVVASGTYGGGMTVLVLSQNQPPAMDGDFGESDDQAADDSSPAQMGIGQGDGSTHFVTGPPAQSFDSPSVYVTGPAFGSLGNTPPPMVYVGVPAASGATAAAVHTLGVGTLGNVSAVTFGVLPGNQPGQAGVTQLSPVVVPSQSTTVESARPIAPNGSTPGIVPGNVAAQGLYTEPLSADSVSPLHEQAPVDREHPVAPSGRVASSQPLASLPESVGVEVDSPTGPLAARGTLLAGIATNFDVLDRALESALEEIENMGGDLAVWLDDSEATAWAAGGAAVLLAGGGYYWQRRRAGRREEADSQELSDWLITHLYEPTGRP